MTAAVYRANGKDELTASSPLYTRKGLVVTAASNDETITLELVRSQFNQGVHSSCTQLAAYRRNAATNERDA